MLSVGSAALLLSFDVAAEAIVEHDDWHTHEHVPERLAIPGFRRGSRWVAQGAGARYFVMYEVEGIGVLTAGPYLERLNHPTPWTSQMMRSYRGMRRALCEVAASFGSGMGATALLIRFAPQPSRDAGLRDWLARDVLPPLVNRPGIVSAHLFATSVPAPMTREQRIRGKDTGLDAAVLVTGYDANCVAEVATGDLSWDQFVARGAEPATPVFGIYSQVFSLAAGAS